MQRDPLGTEIDGPICNKLLSMIGKPDNLITCKAINLWRNRYRINVYTKVDVNGCEGNRITYSCAANVSEDLDIDILYETPGYSGISI